MHGSANERRCRGSPSELEAMPSWQAGWYASEQNPPDESPVLASPATHRGPHPDRRGRSAVARGMCHKPSARLRRGQLSILRSPRQSYRSCGAAGISTSTLRPPPCARAAYQLLFASQNLPLQTTPAVFSGSTTAIRFRPRARVTRTCKKFTSKGQSNARIRERMRGLFSQLAVRGY